jgi:hypothetical protein
MAEVGRRVAGVGVRVSKPEIAGNSAIILQPI